MTTGPLPRRSASFTCLPPGAVRVKSGAFSPTCSALAGPARPATTSSATTTTAQIPPLVLLMRLSFPLRVSADRGWRKVYNAGKKTTEADLRFRLGVGVLFGHVGQEHPVVGGIVGGTGAPSAGDRAGAAGREPLPHVGGSAGLLHLAHLGSGVSRFGSLGLALLLGFLLRLAKIVLATALEAIVPASAHATPRS